MGIDRRSFLLYAAVSAGATGIFPLRSRASSNQLISGLDFPGSSWDPAGACRFTFHDPLPAYPATYIWECMPRRQPGFYTTFFWGPDGSKGAEGFYPERTYYGAHPYPQPRGKWHAFLDTPPPMSATDGHSWEIAIDGKDIIGPRVDYDRWYVQALRVDQFMLLRRKHEFFTDLIPGWSPTMAAPKESMLRIEPDVVYETWVKDDPPEPGLVWGDAPWRQAQGREVFDGIIRGIRIYKSCLSDEELRQEIIEPLSTETGRDTIWYKKMNPAPNDLRSDPLYADPQSPPTPVWSTKLRASLWQPTQIKRSEKHP